MGPLIDLSPSYDAVSMVVIAGGQGSRVGFRQKALLPYLGKPILESILSRINGQAGSVWINANAEIERYKQYTAHVFKDGYDGFLGPLAGMQAAWKHIKTDWAVFIPCDNPALPGDFVSRLIAAYQQHPAPIVVVHDGSRMQPLYLLMHRSMSSSLDDAIEKRHLSVNRWVKENVYAEADFSDCCPDAFQNMNSLAHYDQT